MKYRYDPLAVDGFASIRALLGRRTLDQTVDLQW